MTTNGQFWIIWSDNNDQSLIPKKKFTSEAEALRVAKDILLQRAGMSLWIGYIGAKMTLGLRPVLVENLKTGAMEEYLEPVATAIESLEIRVA